MTDSPDPTDRLSPLHELHERAGASFTDFAGWRMPVRYSSDLAEHHAVRTAAGVFDLSHMGEIYVVGAGAADALDFALAGRLSAIDEHQAKYSLMLDEHGGIVDDLVVYRTGADRYLVVANASNREVVAEELRARCSGFDCAVFDESDDIALIALQGPLAVDVLDELEPRLEAPYRDLKYYRCAPGRIDGHEVLVARTGYTGEDGFEFYLAPDAARMLWQAILDAGAGSEVVPAGLASRDTLRLEAAMPLYGHELSRDIRPQQAGLGRVVAFEGKGDFVGRAALESAADSAAVARVLVGLASDGKRAGRSGYTVLAADGEADAEPTPVGEITSGALSPTLGHPIALAYVDPAHAAVGTELLIDIRGTRVPATVVPRPFYSRKAAS